VTGQPQTETLLGMLRGPLSGTGIDLEDVEISTAGRRRLVRVLIDKDGGISLDEIADATHLVGEVLDGADVLDDTPYTLEVTSPGVDRPLTQRRHWQRNVDRLVKVRPRDGQPYTGRILEAGDDKVVLHVDDGRQVVAYADIAKATVEVEFNRPAKPGRPEE
jgi:ribosome maturation factor RimP